MYKETPIEKLRRRLTRIQSVINVNTGIIEFEMIKYKPNKKRIDNALKAIKNAINS